jgi:hypothetical protein
MNEYQTEYSRGFFAGLDAAIISLREQAAKNFPDNAMAHQIILLFVQGIELAKQAILYQKERPQ